MALGGARALLVDALDQAFHALTADLGTGGGDGRQRHVARPGQGVAVAAADADVAGHVQPLGEKTGHDAGGQDVGQADHEVGALGGLAAGQRAAKLQAVGGRVPRAGLNDLQVKALLDCSFTHALGAQEELGEVGGAHQADALGALLDCMVQEHPALGLVVGGHVDAGGLGVNVEVDGGDGGLGHGRLPGGAGRHGLDEDAGHLGAHEVAQVAALEDVVVVGAGDEQVVAVGAGLCLGPVCDLQAEAVVEARQHQAKDAALAAGQRAGGLRGDEAETGDGLVDELEGLGADLLGVVERVAHRAERDAGLARDVTDLHLCHGLPVPFSPAAAALSGPLSPREPSVDALQLLPNSVANGVRRRPRGPLAGARAAPSAGS